MGGFSCPRCRAEKTQVRETKPGTPFVRIRVCPTCEAKFKTVETPLEGEMETYVNLISRMSSEVVAERLLKFLRKDSTRKSLIAHLLKEAGVKKNHKGSLADLFQ